jgi:L-ascorbate metabolism protein UlaG (beta-lactamase superfamily)
MIDRLTWLGHATVVVELDGVAVITDPVLRAGVGHLRRRAPVPRAPPRLDAVLVSHLHHDHLDPASVARLDPEAIVVAPRGGARVLRRARHVVLEVSAGETVEIGDVSVRAVPAVHDGRRWPVGRPVEALGYVIEGRRAVYFAGDTGPFEAMAELTGLDVALVPISGWGPRLGPGHMGPDEAAAAVVRMGPRLVVPIHWGTLARIGSPVDGAWRDPARTFAALVEEHAPGVRVCVLMPGENVALDGA